MPKFVIGDVVTLQTHPFCAETNNIVISGEYLMIPPLMVIVEVIDSSLRSQEKNLEDKYKCIWFSSKKNQFEESYLLESDLKNVKFEKKEQSIIKSGDLVCLCTLPIELGKERSFLNKETNASSSQVKSSVSALLSFISPIMSVVSIIYYDSTKDKKTAPGLRKYKRYPEKVAKCKWFDAIGEKFSEYLIPLETLMLIPPPPSKLLALLDQAITEKLILKLENTIIRPIQISNRSGSYHLSFFDYISYKNQNLPIENIIEPKPIKNPYKAHAPIFKKRGKSGKKILKLTTSIETILVNAVSRRKKNYIFIKYRDKYNNFTNRTISKYEIIKGVDEFTGDIIEYLKGYCHLRQADRNFKIKSILEVSELDINY